MGRQTQGHDDDMTFNFNTLGFFISGIFSTSFPHTSFSHWVPRYLTNIWKHHMIPEMLATGQDLLVHWRAL